MRHTTQRKWHILGRVVLTYRWPGDQIPLVLGAATVLLCLLTIGWTLDGASRALVSGLLALDSGLFLVTALASWLCGKRADALACPFQGFETTCRKTLNHLPSPEELTRWQAEAIAAREEEINVCLLAVLREFGFAPLHNQWVDVETGEPASPEAAAWLEENRAALRYVVRREYDIRSRVWPQGEDGKRENQGA
jgi:hypothetical protein